MPIRKKAISLKEFRRGDTVFLYAPITGFWSWVSVIISGWGGGPYRFSHCGKVIEVDPIIIAEAKFPGGVRFSDIHEFLEGDTRLFELMRYRNPVGYDPSLGVAWLNRILQDAEARGYDAGQIFANLLNCPWFDDPKRPVCSTLVRDFDEVSGKTLCRDIPRWKIKPNDLARDKQLMFV